MATGLSVFNIIAKVFSDYERGLFGQACTFKVWHDIDIPSKR